jgi:hypothetical protein
MISVSSLLRECVTSGIVDAVLDFETAVAAGDDSDEVKTSSYLYFSFMCHLLTVVLVLILSVISSPVD